MCSNSASPNLLCSRPQHSTPTQAQMAALHGAGQRRAQQLHHGLAVAWMDQVSQTKRTSKDKVKVKL